MNPRRAVPAKEVDGSHLGHIGRQRHSDLARGGVAAVVEDIGVANGLRGQRGGGLGQRGVGGGQLGHGDTANADIAGAEGNPLRQFARALRRHSRIGGGDIGGIVSTTQPQARAQGDRRQKQADENQDNHHTETDDHRPR